MKIWVIGLARHLNICARSVEAKICWVEDAAPCSFREVELCSVLAYCVRVDRKLKAVSKHNVVLNVIESKGILWILIEERLEELMVPIHGDAWQLSVVIFVETVLNEDSINHDRHVIYTFFVPHAFEDVWLLWYLTIIVMVPWEWVVWP
jgi:hypothetical protein